MVSVCELWFFMMMIGSYEPGLVDLIKCYITTYTFTDYYELRNAREMEK